MGCPFKYQVGKHGVAPSVIGAIRAIIPNQQKINCINLTADSIENCEMEIHLFARGTNGAPTHFIENSLPHIEEKIKERLGEITIVHKDHIKNIPAFNKKKELASLSLEANIVFKKDNEEVLTGLCSEIFCEQ